jgi:hypothetical protein
MENNIKNNEIIIECECGTHMLKVQSEVEIFDSNNSDAIRPRVFQEFYFAMFSYGNQKRNFFARCVIAFKYLKSGKMFSDELVLNPDEAQKLEIFLKNNIIETEN